MSDYLTLINRAGKQRMLTQKLMKLVFIKTYEVDYKNTVDEEIMEIIENQIFPIMGKYYNLDNNKFYCKDLFFVKYSMNGQKSLELHKDSSKFSFNILISNENLFTRQISHKVLIFQKKKIHL